MDDARVSRRRRSTRSRSSVPARPGAAPEVRIARPRTATANGNAVAERRGISDANAESSMVGSISRCFKRGRKRKKLFRRRAQSTPSRACACLHGLFHGYPGTQPSSTMPPASPAIACARRSPNPLHLLLTVIGRHGVHCFLSSTALQGHVPATPMQSPHAPQ